MDNIDTIVTSCTPRLSVLPVTKLWHIKDFKGKFGYDFLKTHAVCFMKIAEVQTHPVFVDFFFKEKSNLDKKYLDLYVRTVTQEPTFNFAVSIVLYDEKGFALTGPVERNVTYAKGSCEETRVWQQIFTPRFDKSGVLTHLPVSSIWDDEYRFKITVTPIYPDRDLDAEYQKTVDSDNSIPLSKDPGTPTLGRDDKESETEKKTNASVGESIASDFGSLLSGGENYSDLKLETKDNMTLSTHKFVLSARSIYFRTQIEEEMKKENFDGTIKLQEVNAKPMMAILHWMYTGDISPTAGWVMEEVVNAVVTFELKSLLKILDEKLISVCNADNMFDLYKVAKTNKLASAIAEIAEFIKQNV